MGCPPIIIHPASIEDIAEAICECLEGLGVTVDLSSVVDALTQLQTGFEDGDFQIDIGNLDEIPVGIEAALAPLACTKDTDGNIVGRAFLCKIAVDEENGDVAYGIKWTDGSAVVDYDVATHGELDYDCAGKQKYQYCKKEKFFEGGADNTPIVGMVSDTNVVLTATFDTAPPATGGYASATSLSDQVANIATALSGMMPWAAQVGPFCTNGCGGLPEPVVPVPGMSFRYAGFRVCPGQPLPISVTYTSDQQKKPIELPLDYVETPEVRLWCCVDCEGNEKCVRQDNGEPYTPICAITCGEDFPEIAEPACSFVTVEACKAQFFDENEAPLVDADGNPAPIKTLEGVSLLYSICSGVTSFEGATTLNGSGDPVVVTLDPGEQYVDCKTLAPIAPPVPECPAGANFECGQITYYGAFADNSRWINAPAVNIPGGGVQHTITATCDDGSTLEADGTSWWAIRDVMLQAGYVVNVACANWSQCTPSGWDSWMPAPTIDELFARGWYGVTCGKKITRLEITAHEDEAWVGAYKEIINREGPTEKIRVAHTCSGVFYQDCDGNAIAAPGCCVSECPTEIGNLPLVPCLTCSVLPYSADTIFDAPIVNVVGGSGQLKPLDGAPFADAASFALALENLGYEVTVGQTTIEVCGGSDPVIGYQLDDGTVINATGTTSKDGLLVCDPGTSSIIAGLQALLAATQNNGDLLAQLVDCLCNCDGDDDPCAVDATVTDADGEPFAPIGDAGPNQNFPAPAANDNSILAPQYTIKAPYPECATGTVRLKLAFDHETDGGVYGGSGGGHDGFIVAAPVGSSWVAGSETNGVQVNGNSITVGQRDNSSPYTLDRRVRCIELDVPVADLTAGIALTFAAFGSVGVGGEILHDFTATPSTAQPNLDCSGCGGGGSRCPDISTDPAQTFTSTNDNAGFNSSGSGTNNHSTKVGAMTPEAHAAIEQAVADGCIVVSTDGAGAVSVVGGPWAPADLFTDPVNGGSFAASGVDHTVDLSGDPCAAEYAAFLAQANDGGAASLNTVRIYCQ